jgi:hypothetical protein
VLGHDQVGNVDLVDSAADSLSRLADQLRAILN